MQILSTPINYLKGVGPIRADLLNKELHIFTYKDLLEHYPFRYIDKTKIYNISELYDGMPYIQLKGCLIRFEEKGQRRSKRLIGYFKDKTAGKKKFKSIDKNKDKSITYDEYLASRK